VTEVIEEVAFDIEKEGLTFWPEHDVPEKVSAERHGEEIVGYPALIPNEMNVDLKVLDNETEARSLHQLGVRMLLTLQLKDRIKILKKTPPQFDRYGLSLKTYIETDTLKENFIEIVLNECMNWGEPVPRTKVNFEQLVTFAKKRIGEVIIELSNSLTSIAESYHAITLALKKQKHLTAMVREDIDEQLELLLPAYEKPLFVYEQIKHFPRYLAALKIRIEKYTHRQDKDVESLKGLRRLQDKWIEKVVDFVENDEEVPDMYVDFQYALQELRVSLFAQELKTRYPISLKRVEKQWHEMMLK
jgi:ATP-dependent helicase HrpA